MKVVLAGGSGLVGRHLVRALLAGGHEPVVLSRDPGRASGTLPPSTRVVGWDPGQGNTGWSAELVGADAVINLAGASVGSERWTRRRKEVLRDTRLAPTRALIAALADVPADRRPPVLLSASGTDVYEGRDADVATEATPPAETFLARLCLDWEAGARGAESYGVRVVILRMSLVVAPRAPALSRLALPFRFLLGGPIGSGTQWVSWIDISDAVGIALWALRSPEVSGPVNVAAPDPRRQADFARAIGHVLHRPSRARTPAWLVRLVLGEQAILALGSRRVWPARAIAGGYVFRRTQLEEALADALAGR